VKKFNLPPSVKQTLVDRPWLIATIAILLVALFVPYSWFEPGKVIFSGDEVMAFDPVRFFLERWSVWGGKSNLGAEGQIGITAIIHQFIQAIPAFFGLGGRASEIFHFTFWFVLPGITIAMFMSALSRRLKISRWAVPVAVAYYLFNLYRVANFGDNNHFAIYATLPLLLYWVTQAFDKERPWLPAAAGFALSTLLGARAGLNPPMYIMLWAPVFIYGLALTIVEYKSWLRALKFWLTAAFGTLLVNLFWLIPFLLITARQSSLSGAGNLNWLDDLSKHTDFANVIRQIGAWAWFDGWRGDPYTSYSATYQLPLWRWLTLIPALLALVPLFFKKSWSSLPIMALLLTAAIGIFFAMGTHPPTDLVFRWFAHHVPLFWSFRSPWYKFSNMEAFGYAALIGLGIGLVVDWWQHKKLLIPRAVLLAAAIIVPAVITFPMFNGQMWLRDHDVKLLNPAEITIPHYITDTANWLNEQPGNTAVAMLPYQGAAVFRWGYSSLVDPLSFYSRRTIFTRGDRIGYVPGETPGATTAYRVFKERLYSDDPSADAVARLLGIEYVVVRNDINFTFYDDHDGPEFLKEKFSHQPNFSLVKSFGQWDIYQLKDAKENPIFATTWLAQADGHPVDTLGSTLSTKTASDPFPALFYSRPVPQPDVALTEKIIASVKRSDPVPELTVVHELNHFTVSGTSSTPFALVLNQSYDAYWEAKSDTATITGPAIAYSYAPTWLIQPSTDDGHFTITVAYEPQRYILPSAILSIIAAGILVYLYRRFRAKSD
jgi:hypothetical protein